MAGEDAGSPACRSTVGGFPSDELKCHPDISPMGQSYRSTASTQIANTIAPARVRHNPPPAVLVAAAGQSAGRAEQIESASEVVRQIVAEAHDVVTKLAALTQP